LVVTASWGEVLWTFCKGHIKHHARAMLMV
jgi:hypothetical protein